MPSVEFSTVLNMTRAWCNQCAFTVSSGKDANHNDVRLKATDHAADKSHTVNVVITAISVYIPATIKVDNNPA